MAHFVSIGICYHVFNFSHFGIGHKVFLDTPAFYNGHQKVRIVWISFGHLAFSAVRTAFKVHNTASHFFGFHLRRTINEAAFRFANFSTKVLPQSSCINFRSTMLHHYTIVCHVFEACCRMRMHRKCGNGWCSICFTFFKWRMFPIFNCCSCSFTNKRFTTHFDTSGCECWDLRISRLFTFTEHTFNGWRLHDFFRLATILNLHLTNHNGFVENVVFRNKDVGARFFGELTNGFGVTVHLFYLTHRIFSCISNQRIRAVHGQNEWWFVLDFLHGLTFVLNVNRDLNFVAVDFG